MLNVNAGIMESCIFLPVLHWLVRSKLDMSIGKFQLGYANRLIYNYFVLICRTGPNEDINPRVTLQWLSAICIKEKRIIKRDQT